MDGAAHRPARPHRPSLHSDLTELIDASGGDGSASRAEIASATAAALVQAGRGQSADSDGPFIDLADRIGLETLAALWSHADPVSLPGSLWALYLLRQWCHSSGDEVTRLWRAGEPVASADAAVAGVSDYATVDAVRQVADAVLTGAYQGDFAVALERAAALFRVLAAGRRELVQPDESGAAELALAVRNERVAADLASSAARWRAGTLR